MAVRLPGTNLHVKSVTRQALHRFAMAVIINHQGLREEQ
jgi:hypothetical protein